MVPSLDYRDRAKEAPMQGLRTNSTTTLAAGRAVIEMPEWLEQKLVGDVRRMYAKAVTQAGEIQQGSKKLELAIRDGALAIGASILQAGLERGLGKGYVGSVTRCDCGGRLRYVTDSDKTVTTLPGPVRVRRAYYHCSKCKKGRVPLDEKLGIEGRSFSSTVQEAACLLAADIPFQRAQDLLERLSGVRMSAEECRQIAEAKGEELERQAQQEIEKVWQTKLPAPREAATPPKRIYLSPDGTHTPMLKGWTEARVATIFTASIPRKGEDPVRITTRYVAGIEDADTFSRRLYVEALKQGVDQAEEVIAIGDGAHWIWNYAEHWLPKTRVEIIDFYHASEKIWELARCQWGEESVETKRWAERWRHKLYRGKVDAFINAVARLRPLSEAAMEKQRQTLGYFKTNCKRMRYDEFRRKGYFIGSGVTESSCKHLVGARLKQAGMRWDKNQAQAILQLRAARLNERWDCLWN
jgi:hypothetical protein